MGREFCCNKYCLQKLDMNLATSIMNCTLNELNCLSRKEKKEYILLKISMVCWTGEKSEKGYCKYNWRIGFGKTAVNNVCRKAFCISYDLTPYTLDLLCKCVKIGTKNVETMFSDRTNNVIIIKFATSNGINLTVQQLAALQIPNTRIAVETYSWLDFYFNLVGDFIPNSKNEIHLEPTSILSIYDEYKADMIMEDETKELYSQSDFGKLWKVCFPNVRIREYKAVTGKCNTCAHLSDVRRKCLDKKRKQEVTYLHALHRSAYMGERLKYSQRRQESKQFPRNYLSFISDGMAQSHCVLPHLGNLSSFGNPLPQHLQGILVHGRGLNMYRTFHTVDNGANLQIHTVLLSIEKILQKEGKLPPIFYYQCDGGVENTSKTVLALMELMVAKRIFQKIVWSRLMVGHTHEDIDAVFGRIWKYMRCKHVLTPQAYKQILMECLKRKKVDEFLDVSDIIVIPNYDKFFSGYIDPKFGKYAKGVNTQLQFIFEAVPISESFPLGCKTTYRAYSNDEVVE